MKFTANRSEMQPIIKRCCLVIGRQFLAKEKVCVLMEADEDHNHVQFTAMGNECVLQARLNCYVEHSGKAMMIGSVLQSMLELFREEVTTVETDDTMISVRNAKTGYSFALMDAKKISCSRAMYAGIADRSRWILRDQLQSSVFCIQRCQQRSASAELYPCYST